LANLVNVWVYQGDIVVACYAIPKGVEPLVYPLYHHLIWKAVPDMQELCTPSRPSK
jgi:hypothetical protein